MLHLSSYFPKLKLTVHFSILLKIMISSSQPSKNAQLVRRSHFIKAIFLWVLRSDRFQDKWLCSSTILLAMNGLCSWPSSPNETLSEIELRHALKGDPKLQLGFDSESKANNTGIYRKMFFFHDTPTSRRRVYAFYSSTKKLKRSVQTRRHRTSKENELSTVIQTRRTRRSNNGDGDILYQLPILVPWAIIHSMNDGFRREFERDGIWFMKCIDDGINPCASAMLLNDLQQECQEFIHETEEEASVGIENLVTPSPQSI